MILKEGAMYQERERGAGFTIGVVSGALIGAGVALLFAPKAGHVLRGDVVASAGSLRDAIAARYETLAARAGVSLDALHTTVEGAVEAVEAHAKSALNALGRKGGGETLG
jgi:gas vesicle protein